MNEVTRVLPSPRPDRRTVHRHEQPDELKKWRSERAKYPASPAPPGVK
jgi:hypothetical protein